MEDRARYSARDGRSANVTINNGDRSRIDTEIAYVHNYNEYKMDSAASPAERFTQALKLLAGKMPREAEKIIGEVVRDGHRSNEVAYYWALSVLSGRFFDDLSQEQFATLNKCSALVNTNGWDGWLRALRVVTQFVGCLMYEVREGRLDRAGLTQVFQAYDALDDKRREEIRRHLDLMMTGALQDRMETRYAKEVETRRFDGEREKHAWKFFEPDPCEPVLVQLPEQRMSGLGRAAALTGLIMAGGTQLATFCFIVTAQPLLALLLLAGLSGGGWLIITRGRSWLVRQGQLAADAGRHGDVMSSRRYSLPPPEAEDYTDDYKPGEDDEEDAQHRREQRHLRIHRSLAELWVDIRFGEHDPNGANNRKRWREETRGLRAALAGHIRRHYVRPDQGLGEVDWLIRWHAGRAKTRWEQDMLRQHRDNLRQGSLSDGALFAVGILAAAAGLISGVVGGFEVGRGTEALLVLVTVAGAALIYGSGTDSHYVLRDLRHAETAVAAAEHAEELQAFQEWRDKLDGRPDDEQIARWLDYDKFFIKSLAMKAGNLVNRNLVTHAVLTEDRWPCRSARVLYGPPRYSHYRVTVFLLTEGGVLQVRTDLDFSTGQVSNMDSTSFPYDKIAWAKVAEAGWRFDSGGRRVVVFDEKDNGRHRVSEADGEDESWDSRFRRAEAPGDLRDGPAEPKPKKDGRGDLSDVDSLIFAQALRLSLVEKEPIDIVVENFDRGFLDRLREDKAALRELALDNSGVAGAVRLLNTIAREGRDWLRLQRERHNLKIDDLNDALNGRAELPWAPVHAELPLDPSATVIGQNFQR
jgi:hypothetical protein